MKRLTIWPPQTSVNIKSDIHVIKCRRRGRGAIIKKIYKKYNIGYKNHGICSHVHISNVSKFRLEHPNDSNLIVYVHRVSKLHSRYTTIVRNCTVTYLQGRACDNLLCCEMCTEQRVEDQFGMAWRGVSWTETVTRNMIARGMLSSDISLLSVNLFVHERIRIVLLRLQCFK